MVTVPPPNSAKHVIQAGLPMMRSLPLNPYTPVGYWLLTCATTVGGIVHVGGLTRLTKSGLSMTDWKPLGSLPPSTQEEWLVEFERYKQFPEWEQRRTMTLQEFQFIYYWEWGHRMLGRTVGVLFFVPWGYFTFKKCIPNGYQTRMATLFAMGGAQGLLGWWMVKSGLGEDRRGDRREIRVSPYRLAAHLSMAFATYSVLLWTGLDIVHWPNTARSVHSASSQTAQLRRAFSAKSALQWVQRLRMGAIGTTTLAAITVVSGAFVAGNDAGNAYNTFPKMDGQWIPYEDLLDPELQPKWRNAAEHTPLVQFNHRVLGCTTACSALTLAGVGLGLGRGRLGLTPQVKKGLAAFGTIALGQASLGVATLVNYVPIELAAMHQLGALGLMTSGVYLVHALRYARGHGKVAVQQGVAAGVSGSTASSKVITTAAASLTQGHKMYTTAATNRSIMQGSKLAAKMRRQLQLTSTIARRTWWQ